MKLTQLLESKKISESQKDTIKQLILEFGEDMEFLVESNSPLNFRIGALSEKVKSEMDRNGHLIVRNVPATILDEKNANGRVYTTSTMEASIGVARSNKLFENKQLLCTADDHPDSTFVQPTHGSHIVIDANIKKVGGKNILFNDWLIMDTHNGKDLKAIVKAGASPGTSIRGLGRQDEKTGEIHDYKFLGTDVVGNPSAGTFAPFDGIAESLVASVETVTDEEVEKIVESIGKSNKETKMKFDLVESIEEFKNKHSESTETTSDMVADVLTIEQQVFDNNADVEVYETFKVEVLGKAPEVKKENEQKDEKVEAAKNADVLNKTERKLGASEVVSSHLKTELENVKTEFEDYKSAANQLMDSFAEKAKAAAADLAKNETTSKEDGDGIFKACQEQAVKMIEEYRDEAKKVIENLEYQLEAAIQIGDTIGDNFFAMKAVAESLRARILEMEEDKEDKAAIKSKKDVTASAKSEEVKSTIEKVKEESTDPMSRRRGPMNLWR